MPSYSLLVRIVCVVLFSLLIGPGGVQAQEGGGLNIVQQTADNILGVLDGSGIVIAAIAIFVAGALLLFRAASWGIAFSIVIGGAIMGSAVEIATWLLGGPGQL